MAKGARFLRSVAFVLVSGLAVSTPLVAQPAKPALPPAAWIEWTVVEVNPAMVEEFIAIQREFTAHAKKAKTPWRRVSRTEVFGDAYRFLIATPVRSLATFDKRDDSDPELYALVRRAQRYVTSQKTYAVRTLPDAGNPPPEGKEPALMVVNVVRVAPGREQDFMNVMTSDFLPHFNEAKIHYETGTLAFGGESGFVHAFYVVNFAELDKGSPVVRALGAEGAQAVTAKLAGIVTSSEMWVARLLPEVSYGPTAGGSENP